MFKPIEMVEEFLSKLNFFIEPPILIIFSLFLAGLIFWGMNVFGDERRKTGNFYFGLILLFVASLIGVLNGFL
ncbi:hypothetical protein LSPCS325_53720 [Lysinibacillus sp. CTST325]